MHAGTTSAEQQLAKVRDIVLRTGHSGDMIVIGTLIGTLDTSAPVGTRGARGSAHSTIPSTDR